MFTPSPRCRFHSLIQSFLLLFILSYTFYVLPPSCDFCRGCPVTLSQRHTISATKLHACARTHTETLKLVSKIFSFSNTFVTLRLERYCVLGCDAVWMDLFWRFGETWCLQLTYLFTYLFTYSLISLLIYLLNYWLTYLLI